MRLMTRIFSKPSTPKLLALNTSAMPPWPSRSMRRYRPKVSFTSATLREASYHGLWIPCHPYGVREAQRDRGHEREHVVQLACSSSDDDDPCICCAQRERQLLV